MENLKKVLDALRSLGLYKKVEDFLKDDSIYWQRNPIYRGVKLGNSNTSMQNYGCALMCWSFVSKRNPREVDQLFVAEKVYNGDMINFAKACEALGFKNYLKTTDIGYMPKQEETIKEVKLGKGSHFVVRFNKNNKRTIYDPWLNKILPINYYSFVSYRCFNK